MVIWPSPTERDGQSTEQPSLQCTHALCRRHDTSLFPDNMYLKDNRSHTRQFASPRKTFAEHLQPRRPTFSPPSLQHFPLNTPSPRIPFHPTAILIATSLTVSRCPGTNIESTLKQKRAQYKHDLSQPPKDQPIAHMKNLRCAYKDPDRHR